MHPALTELSTEGIVQPGQSYILLEHPENLIDVRPLYDTYTITSAEELLLALDMEISIPLELFYDVKQCVASSKISADCHEFQFTAYDKGDETDCTFSLYLVRIKTFAEHLAVITKLDSEDE
jgi:hypothetical protein